NVAFVSSNSTSSTNGAVNIALSATTASIQATAVNLTTIDNLSDDVICAFFTSQPNSLQLDNEDLQQIHPDDLDEMDLKWQMAMLTMRARRFLKNTGRKLTVMVMRPLGLISPRWSVITATKGDNLQGSPMNQENKNRENTRRVVPVDITTSNALVSCDGSGYDWSDQAEKGPTNFSLMAHSSTSSNYEVSTDSNCSSSCVENVKIVKEQNEQLLEEFVNESIVSEPTVKKPVVETSEAKASADKPKVVRKNNGAQITEDRRVNTVKDKNVNTARPKAVVNTARPKVVLNAVKGNQVNAVKASACWVWKPKTKGNPQQDLEEKGANVKVKTINGEVKLQALVDGKKLIVTKASVRRDLQLNDEEGTDCLPNATIFEELIRMGYEKLLQKITFYKAFFSPQCKFLIHTILQCLSAKTTAWNEFSSTMASAIICLATNQKFNFLKYIFESMMKNLDNAGKFLMYPRFVQVFWDKQLEGMSSHKRIYVTPSYTKRIFENMKRVGKGFSGRDTPLFPTMMVQAQQEQGEDESVYEERDESLVRVATTATGLDAEQDKGSGPKRQETMRDIIAQSRSENVSKQSNDPLLARGNTLRSGEDRLKLQELMELFKKLEKKGGSRTHKLKRLYKVGRSARVISSDEASLGDQEDASKQGRKIDDIDKDAEITLVHETQGRYADEEMFNTGVLDDDEVLAEPDVTIKDVNLSIDEVTLAQALLALKIIAASTRPKAKGLVIHEEEQATTLTVSSQQPSHVKVHDKGKGIMVEEHVKMKKKDQINLNEELAFKL
ncbi:hypothetical protein Tco_1260624, partial [Tanacetum coccineum]